MTNCSCDTYDECFLETLYRDNRRVLSLGEIQNVKRVIIHGTRCTDGKASALILSHVFGDNVSYEFVQYGTPEYADLEATPGMLFCDFSPPTERVEEFKKVGAIILDHHKGAKEKALSFERSFFADEVDHPGVSGAVLAYYFVFLPFAGFLTKMLRGPTLERMANLIGVRDTWQTKDARWQAALAMHEAFDLYSVEEIMKVHTMGPLGFWAWAKSMDNLGPMRLLKQQQTTAKVASRVLNTTSAKGTPVALFMGSHFSSNTSEKLGELGSKCVLAVGCDLQHNVTDGEVTLSYVFSMRSRKGFDCKKLALLFGGGGHTAAAGFNVPVDIESSMNPYNCFLQLLNEFEAL